MPLATSCTWTRYRPQGLHCSFRVVLQGHAIKDVQVIAEIAYRQLHGDAREHVDLYINAFKGFYSDQSDFPTAAAWADFLPSVGISAFSDWHFIDQPILDSDLLNTTTAPEPSQENIVWALNHCYKTLQFSGAGDIWGRALMLRFLIHLVGDIHQPLHCVNRYSKSNIQKGGDHRGQDIMLKNSHIVTVKDLHNFW
ncbi:hypothetical protein CBR_g38406 [Chara braunii]|uniref:Aspergillus nuclease S1 n=1 Tax=Chara braunii TaxID=69332 RepID=A0A388JNH2_CHABU|nr:hypothetical protein CBR_g38406 [Chara braunii]|eukprot:GBG59380.1 hypothetical protein CBR_g38406 [Chara braunii]